MSNFVPNGANYVRKELIRMILCTVQQAYRRRARRALLLFLILMGLLGRAVLPTSAGNGAYNWYCVHAKDHARPRADAQFSFISRYGGYYLDTDPSHTSPDAEDKVVYLTFDAGYENGNVSKILDTLRDERVPAAFFILGGLCRSDPSLVRRMAEEGHLVCNHSYAHKDMSGWDEAAFDTELKKLESACLEETGVKVAPYFRPPEGRFSQSMLEYAQRMGYKTIFWSFAYADWDNDRQPESGAAKTKILENLHNGAVILLHPTSATNAAILGDVIREIRAQGYRFGTLDELTQAGGAASPEGTEPETETAAPDSESRAQEEESRRGQDGGFPGMRLRPRRRGRAGTGREGGGCS